MRTKPCQSAWLQHPKAKGIARCVLAGVSSITPQIINFGVEHAKGDYLLLLNNDTEVISPDFIEEMMGYLQRPDAGVGRAKLYFADHLVQHAGIVGWCVAHLPMPTRISAKREGYLARAVRPGNFSAVTGACQMVRRDVFEQVGVANEEFVAGF